MFTRSGLDLSAVWDKYSHLCEMDDELRNLERASRAGDVGARQRYITALQRAGRQDAALRHLIDDHRDHTLAWRAAREAHAEESRVPFTKRSKEEMNAHERRKAEQQATVGHHASGMWNARRDAHELAERHGLHLGDHTSRHTDETPQEFLTRVVHMHEPSGTTIHEGGVIRFPAKHGQTRDEVLNRQRPRPRPHTATASSFANMWRRETGGNATTFQTDDGGRATATAVTVRMPPT